MLQRRERRDSAGVSGCGTGQQRGKFKETALKCTEGTFRNPTGKSMHFGLLVGLGFFWFGQVFIWLLFFIQWFSFSVFFPLSFTLKTH